MKKILMLIVSVMATIFLFSCGSNSTSNNANNKETHTHSYTSNVVAPKCGTQGYTIHSCSCGSSYIDSYTNATGHTWVEGEKNYYCSKCNQSEAEYFEFTLMSESSDPYYVLRSTKPNAVVNGVLEIPRKYESLPVKSIANYAISNVTKQIKKLIIHDNIKLLYGSLMHGHSIWEPEPDVMSTLEEIVFDSTCTDLNISSLAFSNCPNLSKVNLKKGMVKYASSDGVTTPNGGTADYLFRNTPYFNNNSVNKNGLYYLCDLLLYADLNEVGSNINIESGTVNINSCIFNKCTTLKSVTIPSSVTLIGSSAFRNCTSLETINYSGTVAQFKKISIGASAFGNLKATYVTCTDGTVTNYVVNGTSSKIGS